MTHTHLALLRGINVSGHHLIKMDALKTVLNTAGFTNVRTYIQTGNVFVDFDDTSAAAGFKIKQEIAKSFGYDVPIVMISIDDLKRSISKNPFLKENNVDSKKLYVAFLSKALPPSSINELKISQFKPDEAIINENMIFIKYAIGAGKTKLDQKYIEKKLNLTATIRNYNTINALLAMFEDFST